MASSWSSNGETAMRHLTAKMETVRIPSESDINAMVDDTPAQQQQQVSPPKQPPRNPNQRPYDVVAEAGPPADPIVFPQPRILRGRRGEVCCYNPKTQDHEMAKNVLFRDFSREFEDGDARVTRAFWPVPFKKPIRTIMGHVEICMVLTRSKGDDDKNSNNFDDSSSEEEEDEDDIIFELTEEMVAVKVNYSQRMEELRHRHAEDPLKEIAAMQIIGDQHPNVMGCIDVLFDGNALNVVMSFCGSGDLFQLLQNSVREDDQPGMTETQARYWFRQVIAGVKHIHDVGICHRDLSPENVMIDGSGALIIDMGMAIRMPYTDSANASSVTDRSRGSQRRMIRPQGACGKLPYMSPEVYRNKHPFDGEAVDVWTCGTILFCMVTGNRSYQRPHPSDPQFYWMTRGLTQLLGDWSVQLSPEGLHLLQNMLQVDPRLRLSIEEIENHPWFSHEDVPQDADDMEFQL
ncbi:activated protein kinase catalytic subunit alpha-1 [Seminavis robusta]|uniref:Activated protein kinase catalytic subunit alpha-1 n=1 Tax=Seminavis robusta TaxID=568900 RepID=A0A9N8DL19_9STRA|nr:activated protein kinase catalytic subunit alpha-1 [Seminavis robusta]|eukprot:Sro216_g089480.1 activated protein kinase catalytic subunit alpha-1 (461) ;mRNA; r:64503-65885